jgi:hypothetical protein
MLNREMNLMQMRSIAIPLVLLTLAVGCSKKKNDNSQLVQQLKHFADSMNAANPNSGGGEAKEGDPCSLLDTADVSAAIGPLAAPPYRGTYRPEEGSSSCRYETKDHRRMLVDVDWSGGPVAMRMIHFGRGLTDGISKAGEMTKGKTVLSTGDTLVGDWDEIAQGPMSCCVLHALRGDQHVELDWTGTRMSMPAAGVLLNSAVKRLDHPLAINGSAGIPAGQKLYAADAQDSAVNMCTLVPQAVVEAVIGAKLIGPPQPGSQKGAAGLRDCTYQAPGPSANIPRTFELTVWEWHDGAVEFTSDQYIIHGATRAMSKQFTGDTSKMRVDTSAYPVGPWEEAGPTTSMGFEAVEGPFLVKSLSMFDRDKVLKLLGTATTALKPLH